MSELSDICRLSLFSFCAFSESINVPNTRQPSFTEITAGYRGTWQQGTWGIQPTTAWPPQFELIEGFNVSAANLLANVTNGANTTSTTGIQTVRYLINQEVRLLAPPTQ